MKKNKQVRKYEEGAHFLSMHVVFYETCISTVDLQAIKLVINISRCGGADDTSRNVQIERLHDKINF